MSLLNFLFRTKKGAGAGLSSSGTVVNPPDTISDPDQDESDVFVEDTKVRVHRTLTDENGVPNLEEIRATLSKIAEIINDEEKVDQEEEDQANLSTIDMSIGQMAGFAEGLFKEEYLTAEVAGKTIGVRIADFYEQLKGGKVVTTMSRLLTDVPAEILRNPANSMSKEEIAIPLHLAVTSVRPDELMKRTSSTEMEIGLKDMPNLFSMGGGTPTLRVPEEKKTDSPDLFGATTPAVEPAPPKPQEPAPSKPQKEEAKEDLGIAAIPDSVPDVFSPTKPPVDLAPVKPEKEEAKAEADVAFKPEPKHETTSKEPLAKEKTSDEEIFSRTPQSPSSPPSVPAPDITRERAPKTQAKPPEEPVEEGRVTFEFNENATPFRRADEVPAKITEPEKVEEPVAEKSPALEEVAAKGNTTFEAPVAEEQVVEESIAAEGTTLEEPIVEDKVIEESITTESATLEELVVEEKAIEEPAAAEDATFEEPVVEEKAIEEPVVTEGTTLEELVVEEKAIDEPAATEDATVEESVVAESETAEVDTAEPATEPNKVMVAEVDLNQATVEELTTKLDGVGKRLAENIVRYREQKGAFISPSDLVNVPGVGPTTFERLSGQSWSAPHDDDDLKQSLDFILGTETDGYPDFRRVADRFCEGQNFSGCIIIHSDGHVLASAWENGNTDIVGAVVPQIFKKVIPYAQQLAWGEVNPISLVFGDQVVTMVHTEDVLIATIHELDQLDKTQLRIVQLASVELEERMERART